MGMFISGYSMTLLVFGSIEVFKIISHCSIGRTVQSAVSISTSKQEVCQTQKNSNIGIPTHRQDCDGVLKYRILSTSGKYVKTIGLKILLDPTPPSIR